MNKVFYEDMIEKTASSKMSGLFGKAIATAGKHKKVISGVGAGAGMLGGAYALSDQEDKAKIKSGIRTAGKSVATAQLNGQAQDIIKNIGGIAGTALALKKGKSLGKAISGGGLAGMALGDIAGASTIPAAQLYKKHKKEFGTAPDVKSMATVVGSNLLPTAALWGGLYGVKKGVSARKSISNNLNKSISGTIDSGKALKRHFGHLRNNPAGIDAIGGPEGVNKLIKRDIGGISKGILSAGKSFVPVAAAAEIASIPTYFATPENVINMKKKKLKQELEGKSIPTEG